MPFNLLLLPLLGGFLFFCHGRRTSFFAQRQDRERLLLYSSLWGAVFLAISFLCSALLVPHFSRLQWLRTQWAYNTPRIEYSGISTFALLLGSVLTLTFNTVPQLFGRWNSKEEGNRAVLTHGSQLEKIFYRSLSEEKLIMVTLKNGKVYIGRMTHSLIEGDEDFNLLPSKSGFRDNKQELIVTTDYDQTYSEIAAHQTENYREIISAFGVVIKLDEVLTASLYLESIHDRYFRTATLIKFQDN
jgi:hypothetical protein